MEFLAVPLLIECPVLDFKYFSKLDWIIIGADSSKGAKKPPLKWVDFLKSKARPYNLPIFIKDNYQYPEIIKEFPKPLKEHP